MISLMNSGAFQLEHNGNTKQIQINNQRIQIMVVMLHNQSKSLFPKDDSFILSRSKGKKAKRKRLLANYFLGCSTHSSVLFL